MNIRINIQLGFYVLIPFLLINLSCNKQTDSKGFHNTFSMEDSTQLVTLIDSALQIPAKNESYILSAKTFLNNHPELQDVYDLTYGRYLILSGQIEEARSHIQSVLDSFESDTLNLELAKYHNLMAAVYGYSMSYDESVSHFKQAIQIYETHKDYRNASVIKFNLANIFFSRSEYESAHKYSLEALSPLEEYKDTSNLVLCLSLLSVAETRLNNLNKGEEYAKRATDLAKSHPNFQGKLFSKFAVGQVQVAKGEYDESITLLTETINLGEERSMFQWLLPVRAALLKAYINNENYLEAVNVGKQLLEQASTYNNEDIKYTTLKHLAIAQGKLGQYEEAFKNMNEAERLTRENMTLNSEKILRETLIHYETEKKNNIILLQESKLSNQRLFAGLIFFVAIFIITILFWIVKNTKQLNKILVQEKENIFQLAIVEGEESERKRVANELHDGIASNLVALKLKIENHDAIDLEKLELLSIIEKTHEEVRLIAHNLAPLIFRNRELTNALETFAKENSHGTRQIKFYTNNEEECNKLPKNFSMIIYRSVQELVQNAIKHADATLISIQLILKENEI